MSTDRIRTLNDAFRRSFSGGKVLMTAGVAALPLADQIVIQLAVREFDKFDADNDPHGEHDFGAFEHAGVRYFWKIDYYDLDCLMHSPDPADPAMTTRVLTIMRADEY